MEQSGVDQIGERIVAARRAADLSGGALAEAIGQRIWAVERMEAGKAEAAATWTEVLRLQSEAGAQEALLAAHATAAEERAAQAARLLDELALREQAIITRERVLGAREKAFAEMERSRLAQVHEIRPQLQIVPPAGA